MLICALYNLTANITDTKTAEDKLVCTLEDNDLISGLPGIFLAVKFN